MCIRRYMEERNKERTKKTQNFIKHNFKCCVHIYKIISILHLNVCSLELAGRGLCVCPCPVRTRTRTTTFLYTHFVFVALAWSCSFLGPQTFCERLCAFRLFCPPFLLLVSLLFQFKHGISHSFAELLPVSVCTNAHIFKMFRLRAITYGKNSAVVHFLFVYIYCLSWKTYYCYYHYCYNYCALAVHKICT